MYGPWEWSLTRYQLMAAVTDKRSTGDTNRSGGHTAGLIPVANGFQYPRANLRAHSASGRWNENTLVDINPRCFYTCTFRICEIEVINEEFLPTWPALFVCSTAPGHQVPRGRHGRRGRRICVKHPIFPMEWQSRGDYRPILCHLGLTSRTTLVPSTPVSTSALVNSREEKIK